jgi:hypothetical protein
VFGVPFGRLIPSTGRKSQSGPSTDRHRVRSGLPLEAPPAFLTTGSLPTAPGGRLSVRKSKSPRWPSDRTLLGSVLATSAAGAEGLNDLR